MKGHERLTALVRRDQFLREGIAACERLGLWAQAGLMRQALDELQASIDKVKKSGAQK